MIGWSECGTLGRPVGEGGAGARENNGEGGGAGRPQARAAFVRIICISDPPKELFLLTFNSSRPISAISASEFVRIICMSDPPKELFC